MTETDKKDESSQDSGNIADADDLVRIMGLIFNNTFLYGSNHGVTRKAIQDGFAILAKILDSCEEVLFNITDEGLLVNGRSIELKNPLMQTFVAHLTNLEIYSFSLTRGMTEVKFKDLIEVLNAKPEELSQLGGFAGVVSDVGLDNVRVSKVIYKRVAEDEVVTSKEEAEGTDLAKAVEKIVGSGQEPAEGGGGKEKEKGEEGINVAGILAFLKGDVSTEDGEGVKNIQDAAPNPRKLAELIMRAAVIRPETADVEGGEEFGGLVVGCLRRAYDGMLKSPSVKTQKGKKTLTKTLMLLEKDILDKMREMAGEVRDSDRDAVSDAIEGMTGELKIDALAAEYMKKRNAIETSEDRLLRFIKSKGADGVGGTDLQKKLSEDGLTPDGWQELLVKSGAGDAAGIGIGGAGMDMAALGNLAVLLTRIEKEVEKSTDVEEDTAETLTSAMSEVGREVNSIVAGTEQKIEGLVKDIQADEEIVETAEKEIEKQGRTPALSRKKLLALLAEIVQEFCQPLSVINCSVEMIRSKNLGAITDHQIEMLNLALDSGEKLKKLIDRLLEISGLPSTMSPDADIQASLYK